MHASTLTDLGVNEHLAADAVAFAGLTEGREAGTVAKQGTEKLDAARISDLGIGFDLAADALAFSGGFLR